MPQAETMQACLDLTRDCGRPAQSAKISCRPTTAVLAGVRQTLQLLEDRCPNVVELDLSGCVDEQAGMLITVLPRLSKLQARSPFFLTFNLVQHGSQTWTGSTLSSPCKLHVCSSQDCSVIVACSACTYTEGPPFDGAAAAQALHTFLQLHRCWRRCCSCCFGTH